MAHVYLNERERLFWLDGSVFPSGRGLFRGGYFFGCAMFLGMPQVSGDCESIHGHAQGTRRKRVELLPVRAVFIDGLDSRRGNDTRADAADSTQLIRLAVWSVDGTELTVRIPQQDQEMTGRALLHLLQSEKHLLECRRGPVWR